MATTTIPLGLEIRRLAWKDDSFRQADHEPQVVSGVPLGMLGWWDDTIQNAITFSNVMSTTGNTTPSLAGGITTIGAFGPASPAITNGDELYLPGGITVEKDFLVAIPADMVNDLRLRARNAGSTTHLHVLLLDSSLSVVEDYKITLASSLYTHYTLPILYGAGDYSVSEVYGIQLECDNGAYIDYVAFGSIDYVNQGGQSMNVTIPKKTGKQTRPNATDIIQQLGISSRSVSILIPKINYTTYVWLKDKLNRAIPIELLTPTQQTTGYIVDVKRHSEWGWVGVFSS